MENTLIVSKKWVALLCFIFLFMVCVSSIAENTPILILNETSLTLVKGKTMKLAPSVSNVENAKKLKYTWESSNPSIATVTNGTVKAVDGGNAIITCGTILEDGTSIKATTDVTVTVPVTSLKLTSAKQLTMKVGASESIQYEIAPQNASDQSLEWTSSDYSIVSVDKDGIITAKSAGKATVTATTKDGSKKKAQVSVYVPSLYSSVSSVNVDSTEGESAEIFYFGKNWNNDVNITQKGNAFSYSVSRDNDKYNIKFLPISAGAGSITITDKKDAKCKIKIDVNVTNGAIQINQYIIFSKVTCKKGIINFSFKNNSGQDIAEYVFVTIPYNQFDEQIFISSEIGQERRYFTFTDLLKSGNSKSKNNCWYTDENERPEERIDHVDVALEYLRFADGTIVHLSNRDLLWFSSKMNSYKSHISKKTVNSYPDKALLDKDDSFMVGYSYQVLNDWEAKNFGYHHGGYYVTDVVPDSIADKCGLRKKDLIISVDGVLVSDDRYANVRGKGKMVDGESVNISVERLAQEGTIDLVWEK